MEADYLKMKVDPIFEPIKKLFEFFILSIGFVGQFDFQKEFLKVHSELAPLVNNYNKEVNLRVEGSGVKSDTKLYWVSIGRLMAIALFDILQFSSYQNSLNKTEIFKFAKHIRNGAAHNNKFYFEKPLEKPVQWKDKLIDNSLKGKTVFPDFINPTMLIFLMSDISKLIEIEKRKKPSPRY